ncbi:sugar O-acetyltransferase [Enterovibrio nigricans]|uniref:Nodulation protein L n=1 Tax=Enterovibrio nigricans DSM 22720 TaxID=1121868 RepID=A0A1T4VQP9_9GAMM|nr:sugar O-acetyltransferase [Enterovibrio nigricans]PKF49445.1 sugar O-acetyltransferase [Enterovibrio nigricans]SKA67249.1 maltose O-acetyltransferase [Enterovibrio nigricans DSM 22720]
MKTEKQKMLSSELYRANDAELVADKMRCRKAMRRLNQSLPETADWEEAKAELLPNAHKSVYIEPPFYCDYGDNIHVGESVFMNFNCTILDVAPVSIGNRVLMASNVQLLTAGHPLDVQRRVYDFVEYGLPITIENNVWLGGGVIVLPGVTIGENSIIGAGSVVTQDIPANVIAVGNPAKVLRVLTDEEKEDRGPLGQGL